MTKHRRAEPWAPARSRPAFALAIVLLHLLLAGALLMRAAPRMREPVREERWTAVRALPPPTAVAPPQAPATPVRRAERDPDRKPPAPPRQPAPITLPMPAATGEPDTAGAAVAAAAAPASAASAPGVAPLVIPSQGLARGTRRHPALDDARANRPLESPGERFARTLGTDDRIVEEQRGEGRHRVRQGTSCVDVKVGRDAQLDPFNQSYRPTPRLAGPCP